MALNLKDVMAPMPKPEFWAVVALSQPDKEGNRDAWYIQKSPDGVERDLLVECSTDADGDGMAWAKDKPAGVYRLTFDPTGGHDWFDLNVVEAVCLWELPA